MWSIKLKPTLALTLTFIQALKAEIQINPCPKRQSSLKTVRPIASHTQNHNRHYINKDTKQKKNGKIRVYSQSPQTSPIRFQESGKLQPITPVLQEVQIDLLG